MASLSPHQRVPLSFPIGLPSLNPFPIHFMGHCQLTLSKILPWPPHFTGHLPNQLPSAHCFDQILSEACHSQPNSHGGCAHSPNQQVIFQPLRQARGLSVLCLPALPESCPFPESPIPQALPVSARPCICRTPWLLISLSPP